MDTDRKWLLRFHVSQIPPRNPDKTITSARGVRKARGPVIECDCSQESNALHLLTEGSRNSLLMKQGRVGGEMITRCCSADMCLSDLVHGEALKQSLIAMSDGCLDITVEDDLNTPSFLLSTYFHSVILANTWCCLFIQRGVLLKKITDGHLKWAIISRNYEVGTALNAILLLSNYSLSWSIWPSCCNRQMLSKCV